MKKFKYIFLIIICLILGFRYGLKTYEYLAAKGCFRQPHNIIDLPQFNNQSTVHFLVLGDVGTHDQYQKKVAKAAFQICQKLSCDFALLLGDNFMPQGVESLNDPLFIKTFTENYQDFKIPFFTVLGNHDVKGDVLSQLQYTLINPQWKMPNFRYSFTAGPAQFHGINTNCNIFGWIPLIKTFENTKSTQPWTFLFGHHPLYSTGFHGDNELQVRWLWKWYLNDHVDFYLSGHDHHLEHLQKYHEGVEYIVAGSGGDRYTTPQTQSSSARSLYRYQDNGFIWAQAASNQVLMKFFNANAEQIYQFIKTTSKPNK